MKIAVEGCAHGELERIYECIEAIQEKEGIKVDLLICCGDFQAVRNKNDLKAMAVPEKYQNICTFYKYYSGEKQAPVLTLFIGGNHEASNYLQELPYGGWVAPKIYYMGRAGVVKFGNFRIAGLSGIFKGRDYLQGLWECPPYTPSSMRSVYHIRSLDVFRLSQAKDKIHVMLTHDWPRGITQYGDKNNLLKRKPFLREDIESNQLGSAPAENLLYSLKPDYWFAAHLHCQFAAIVEHDGNATKFLALDKCLPKRRHLQILDLPQEYDGDKLLRYDEEWLAILKNTNHLLTVKNVDCHMPGPGGDERFDFTPTTEEKESVIRTMENMIINEDTFVRTAPAYTPNSPRGHLTDPIMNPQTVKLCEKLGIDDPLQVLIARSGRTMKQPLTTQETTIPIATPEIKTPIKSKLSLPAPVTPNDADSEEFSHSNSLFSPENATVSDSSNCNTVVECSTPVSSNVKKSFKRRNQSLYTLDNDESLNTTSSSIIDPESPRSNKLPHITDSSES